MAVLLFMIIATEAAVVGAAALIAVVVEAHRGALRAPWVGVLTERILPGMLNLT